MASGSYRPQSPDLSSIHANNLSGYRPESPDLSGLSAPDYTQQAYQPLQNSAYSHFDTKPPTFQPTSAPFTQHYTQQYDAPVKMEDQYMSDVPSNGKAAIKTESDPTLGVVLSTSFPVARIKRIMQADEDIGKVAQVTPHVVSRALELFMIKLITASSEQARGGGISKGPRKVLPQHIKKAIQADDTFDFLADIIAKVPDAPTKGKKESTSDGEDAKPKKRAKKRKDSTDGV